MAFVLVPQANSLSFAPISPTDGRAGSRRADAEGPPGMESGLAGDSSTGKRRGAGGSPPRPPPQPRRPRPSVAEQELLVACRTIRWDQDTEVTSKDGANTDGGGAKN